MDSVNAMNSSHSVIVFEKKNFDYNIHQNVGPVHSRLLVLLMHFKITMRTIQSEENTRVERVHNF